jgi:hypothetical protein
VNPFSLLTHEELNILKRQTNFLHIMKAYDEGDLHRLFKGFILLS